MPKIEIYTRSTCPYCVRAIMLLDRKGLKYKHIEVGDDPKERDALQEKAEGRRTVPQIFINDLPIGGYDDLAALEDSGKLDDLLKD